MKTKSNLFIAAAVLLSLVAGFLIGISVDYPKLDSDDLSGTVGKVKNYRNAKASEEDIRLRDQLVTDTLMAGNIMKYMQLQYVKAVQLSEVLEQASVEIEKEKNFKVKNPELLSSIEKFRTFLETTKPNFLLTVVSCSNAKGINPVLLRHSVTRSKETIVQMNYGNNAVLNLISALEDYITKEKSADKQIKLAHDLLVRNQVGNALVFQDKVLMKYFEKKMLFGSVLPTSNVNIEENIIKDMETLKGIEIEDAEHLGANYTDQEKLGLDSFEKLNSLVNDVSSLGMMDIENLGINDAEKLGFDDVEKLGFMAFDSEVLGLVLDMESLGMNRI